MDVANDLYRRFVAGDLDGVMALLDPDVRWELVGPSEIPYLGPRRGTDAVRDFFAMLGEYLDVRSFEWTG